MQVPSTLALLYEAAYITLHHKATIPCRTLAK
jgi:hypothetical protein